MRGIIALIVGFFLLNIIALFGENMMIPGNIKLIIANFIGGFSVGFISKRHGIYYGLIISFGSLFVTIAILIYISYNASGGGFFFPKVNTMYMEYLATILGPIGGYCGEKIIARSKNRRG